MKTMKLFLALAMVVGGLTFMGCEKPATEKAPESQQTTTTTTTETTKIDAPAPVIDATPAPAVNNTPTSPTA